MKTKGFLLSVFNLVMIGFLFLGSQNIHALSYHSAEGDNDIIVHCEQCDFIYSHNHTSFLKTDFTQLSHPFIFNDTEANFVSTYQAPDAKIMYSSYYLNRPPPAIQ